MDVVNWWEKVVACVTEIFSTFVVRFLMKKTPIMKKIIMLLVAVALALPAGAVLTEPDLAHTLGVLRTELTKTHRDQQVRMQRFNMFNTRYYNQIVETMDQCNRIELMLYSQKEEFVFDQAYACNQATELYNKLSSRMAPFKSFEQRYNEQMAQYDQLIISLEKMEVNIKTAEMRADRDSCLHMARAIRSDIVKQVENIKQNEDMSKAVVAKAKVLNDYAMRVYDRIRQNVFVNGEQSYPQVLRMARFYLRQSRQLVGEKYGGMGPAPAGRIDSLAQAAQAPMGGQAGMAASGGKSPSNDDHMRSEWRGPLVGFLLVFIVIYVLLASVLSYLAIRFLVPKRFITHTFQTRRSAIVLMVATALFAVVCFAFHNLIQKHYFMIMATGLLGEYALLVLVIVLSIIIRTTGDNVKSSLRVYLPIMVLGFIVFLFRITLMPSVLVNLVFPIILLLCAIWQFDVIRRHNRNVPRSDMFYTWVTFIVMVVSLVVSWQGYTLMAVQVLIWWIMQLTMIQAITVVYDWLHRYQNKHIPADAGLKRTWFYDFIYKAVTPCAAVGSIALSIYWAARVFNLTEWVEFLYHYKFVNIDGVIVLSLSKLMSVVMLGFVFNYLIYLAIEIYKLWKIHRNQSKVAAASLLDNIIKYIGWGIYIYIVMVVLKVNRAGITLILTGLSTGIGFAMKDTIENLFYGISLMNGRVKIGDVIECEGVRGKVTNINYQSTLVETMDGSVIAFLNSQLFSKNFKNMTRNHGYVMSTITVGVAYGSQVNQVRQIIVDRLNQLDCFNREKGVQVHFTNFGASSVDLLVVVWVPVMKEVAITAKIKENIYEALNENNIEIPFPQSDIHIRGEVAKTLAPVVEQK